MAHLALLNDYHFESAENDVRGSLLRGEGNEELGRVCDVVVDHASGEISFLVADTGHDRKVLIPVEAVAATSDALQSQLAPEDLERLPVFDESMLASPGRWHDYEELYRSAMEDIRAGGVLLSPPQKLTATKITSIDRQRNSSSVRSWTTLANKWESFARQVRSELHQIRSGCGTCRKYGRRIA